MKNEEWEIDQKKKIDLPDDIKVDAPILVSKNGARWTPRHFARKGEDEVLVYGIGRTSWTSTNDLVSYEYARLPEPEESEQCATDHNQPFANWLKELVEIKKSNRWIPVTEALPENEEVVEITYKRKDLLKGGYVNCTARAFYTDGMHNEEDSAYGWEYRDSWEYDAQNDVFIVPKGWWEDVSFSENFNIVCYPVVAWRPLAKAYGEK